MNSPEDYLSSSTDKPTRTNDSAALASSVHTTLRSIAELPPPLGLEDRLHASLRAELHGRPRFGMPKAQVLAWPAPHSAQTCWLHSSLLRAAAAAAIVAIVLGGGWGIVSRFQPATTAKGAPLPNRAVGPGGFSSAGAMRTPQTLHGPVVLPGMAPAHTLSGVPVKTKTPKKPILPNAPAEDNKAVVAVPTDSIP
jgi:hypothetical protein